MSRFNTGNPLGSDALQDLSDNAKNADLFSNDVNNRSYKDRFGRNRKTIHGMESEFNRDQKYRDDRFKEFLLSSGYQFVGGYGAGVELTEYNQLVRDENGEFWRLSGQMELPYITTGLGVPEDGALVSVGDTALRQELADPDKGAALVRYGDGTVAEKLDELISYTKLNPRNFGVVGDGVTDDSDAIDALLSYMQSIAQIDHRGFNMRGTGIDFSGLTCSVSRPINLMGFSNYTLVAPAFTASPDFVGDSLISIFKRSEHDWQINNITFISPYFDCNWACDYAVSLTDYVKVKLLGGYIYRYRKKGINSVKHPTRNCHELNLVGTFIFQTEAGEDYPADITEGEAYYIDSPDNNFSNVVIGYQKSNIGTATGGPTHFSNCHFYGGRGRKIYGNTSDHFIGCYFDGVELVIGSRTTVLGNLFVVSAEEGLALTLPKNNFGVRVQANQFKKIGSRTDIINYPPLAERNPGFKPSFIDNVFDNSPGFSTESRIWINGANATQTSFTIPDRYLPLSSHRFGGWIDSGNNPSSGTEFITTELSSTKDTVIMRAYKLNESGALIAQNMSGMSFYLALNL